MKNCVSSVTVTNGKSGDDEFYWKLTNEYRNLSTEISDEVTKGMTAMQQDIKRISSGKATDGLTATLEATIDGQPQKALVFAGISYGELAEMQHEGLKYGASNIHRVKDHATRKDKKHGNK